MTAITYHGPSARCTDAHAGDWFLWRGTGWTDRLIRFGQRLRLGRRWAHFNHAGIFTGDDGMMIEADWHVIEHHIAAHDGEMYAVVHMDASDTDRQQAVAFARSRVGQPYGFLNVVSSAIALMTDLPLVVAREGHPICSGLVARCLERMGEIIPREPLMTTPGHLAQQYGVEAPQ